MRGASTAAAGMLAARDPHNPPEVLSLSRYSLSLYPQFLERIANLSGTPVPYQTDTTIQYLDDQITFPLKEHSLDPRQLASAVLAAIEAAKIPLIEEVQSTTFEQAGDAVHVRTASGAEFLAPCVVHAEGAGHREVLHSGGRKGQMLRVALPPSLKDLCEVHRRKDVYLVPRTTGPQAGTALIGATVEEVDEDTDLRVHQEALTQLRTLAAEIFPEIGDPVTAPMVESWAGIRPWVIDGLPLLGPASDLRQREFLALGHFRNGILHAPGTASLLADLIEGKSPAIDAAPFSFPRKSVHKS